MMTLFDEVPTVLDAYESFDRREEGWATVVLGRPGPVSPTRSGHRDPAGASGA